jgi:tetratricopeptide (TPR) repeat protein
MKWLFSITLIITVLLLSAQEIPDREFYRRIDLGESLMKSGEYEDANQEFLYVLQNMPSLPSKVAYFFGRNSYHLGQYKQSINWLNKYLQLQGTSAAYYEQAVSFLNRAEDEYMKIQRSDTTHSDLMTPSMYDCGGLSKMICPVCNGDGVVIKSNPFGKVYETCPYCIGNSYLSCEDYNLFMMGRLDAPSKKD